MANETKSYPTPWQGRVLLACRKCQKKLKHDDMFKALANLKKTAKVRSKLQRRNGRELALLHIVNVSCMDLCPKNAVTLCVPGPVEDRLYILRAAEDLDRLYP